MPRTSKHFTLTGADGKSFIATKTELLVLQATSFCNIDCRYCYLPNRSQASKMPTQTVAQVFNRMAESPFLDKTLSLVWHAGEPLTIGLEFYQRATEHASILKTHGCTLRQSVQTNGILLSRDWCDWFNEANVRVGVSIDGPAHIHDRNRVDRNGKGTHARVKRGMDLLREHNVPFHVICVLTDYSLDYPEEMFEFFLRCGTRSVCFNVEEVEGVHRSSTLSSVQSRARFTQFLETFLNLAIPAGLNVREHAGLRKLLLSKDYGQVHGLCSPFTVVSVAGNGDFSTFSPELLTMKHDVFKDFVFGNVHSEPLLRILDMPKFRLIYDQIISGVDRCRSECDYFPLCGGARRRTRFSKTTRLIRRRRLTVGLRSKP